MCFVGKGTHSHHPASCNSNSSTWPSDAPEIKRSDPTTVLSFEPVLEYMGQESVNLVQFTAAVIVHESLFLFARGQIIARKIPKGGAAFVQTVQRSIAGAPCSSLWFGEQLSLFLRASEAPDPLTSTAFHRQLVLLLIMMPSLNSCATVLEAQ